MLGETAEDPAVDGSHDVIDADSNASHLRVSSVLCCAVLFGHAVMPLERGPGTSRLQRCILINKTSLRYHVSLLALVMKPGSYDHSSSGRLPPWAPGRGSETG